MVQRDISPNAENWLEKPNNWFQKHKSQSFHSTMTGLIKRVSCNDNPICKTEKETQMYRTDFWTLWKKARVGCFKRTASKHVYYLGWNRSPVQVGCMRQVLGPGALGRPRGIRRRGRWEGGIGMGNTCKTMADSCQCMTKTTTIL